MSRPAAPESETPLVERLKDAGWNESSCRSAFDEAIYAGAPIWACEQIQEIAELCTEAATALSLAQTEIKGHMRVVDELKHGVAELEKDAARYRWLRQSDCRDGVPFVAIFDGRLTQWTGKFADEQVDSAIDAALKSRA